MEYLRWTSPTWPEEGLNLHWEQSQGKGVVSGFGIGIWDWEIPKGFGNCQMGSARNDPIQSPCVADQDFLHFPLENKNAVLLKSQAFSRIVLGSALYIPNAESNMQIRLKCSIFTLQELRISTSPFKIIFAMKIIAWCNIKYNKDIKEGCQNDNRVTSKNF